MTGCKSPVNVHISGGARSSTYEQGKASFPASYATPHGRCSYRRNQGGSPQWQAPHVDHEIHDVIPTEKHQPEDLPVLVPAEDHVAEDPEEVLTGTLNV